MDTKPKELNGDMQAQLDFAECLAQSLEDDLDCEGYFYQGDPSLARVGKPSKEDGTLP